MSDLHVEDWSVARLRPYAHNPRKNDAAVPRMVEALREFGFRIPILAKSDGEVMCLVAAWELGLRNRKPPSKGKQATREKAHSLRPMPPVRNLTPGERLAALGGRR